MLKVKKYHIVSTRMHKLEANTEYRGLLTVKLNGKKVEKPISMAKT